MNREKIHYGGVPRGENLVFTWDVIVGVSICTVYIYIIYTLCIYIYIHILRMVNG